MFLFQMSSEIRGFTASAEPFRRGIDEESFDTLFLVSFSVFLGYVELEEVLEYEEEEDDDELITVF